MGMPRWEWADEGGEMGGGGDMGVERREWGDGGGEM